MKFFMILYMTIDYRFADYFSWRTIQAKGILIK